MNKGFKRGFNKSFKKVKKRLSRGSLPAAYADVPSAFQAVRIPKISRHARIYVGFGFKDLLGLVRIDA